MIQSRVTHLTSAQLKLVPNVGSPSQPSQVAVQSPTPEGVCFRAGGVVDIEKPRDDGDLTVAELERSVLKILTTFQG